MSNAYKSFSESAEKRIKNYAKGNYVLVAYIVHKNKLGHIVNQAVTPIGRFSNRQEATAMINEVKYMTIQRTVEHRNGIPVMEEIKIKRPTFTFWNGKENISEHILKFEILTKEKYLSSL